MIPPHWPKWKKKCGIVKRGRPPCRNWAVIGMPTCKLHGSGGEKNRKLGQLRYLAWVIIGGPQDMPVKLACEVSLSLFAERILKKGDPDQQMKAAMWITKMLE